MQRFGGSCADENLIGVELFACRNGLVEIVEFAIVVAIGFASYTLNRLEDGRRMRFRIFVGVQPDGVFGRRSGDVGALREVLTMAK